MTHAIIRHCPDSAALLDFADDVVLALLGEDVFVEMADGDPGEFTVLVDGESVVAGHEGRLPTVEEVVAAVTEAGTLPLAV